MKTEWCVVGFLMLALCTSVQLHAQQSGESFEDTKAKAQKGDANAQFKLGWMYQDGQGVSKDPAEAIKWYRKAAEQGSAKAQGVLGFLYGGGQGVERDYAEAIKWYRKAAEQGDVNVQVLLGQLCSTGTMVATNGPEAAKWYRKAAEQGNSDGEVGLGNCYSTGTGVDLDLGEAVKWWRKAAEQGNAIGQQCLGDAYLLGLGVAQDYIEAHKWLNLASAQGQLEPRSQLPILEQRMTTQQIAEAQRLARDFKPRNPSGASVSDFRPSASGTGFFITEDGYLITNDHVVKDAVQVRLVTRAGLISAKVVKVDAANDLALLKAEGRFAVLPVASSRGVKMGSTVATVGFPNIGLQGFAPKLAKGEIASLSGAADDARYFQISVPVQPGNSGGALVDQRGNVVGVVSAKLDVAAAVATSGALPENVNYAVKSSFLLGFLESVPQVSAKLKEPSTKDSTFEDVVKSTEKASALVLMY